jgi:hypothetical protein
VKTCRQTKELTDYRLPRLATGGHCLSFSVFEAVRFTTKIAVMVVHSFSQEDLWFEEYERFGGLYGANPILNVMVFLCETQGVKLFSGWAKGGVDGNPV